MKTFELFRTALGSCALLLLGSQLAMCGLGSPTSCTVPGDCWNSDETKSLGRCAPKEVGCVEGGCRADCPALCEVVEAAVNPCKDPARICNQSKSGVESFAYCAAAPIGCASADDCPLARPASGEDPGAWSCDAGFCRFPGFHYLWE